MTVQHVVIGIIIDAEQRILVAQRLPHQTKPGYWEFPGGKVELNESAFSALKREFREEIGIHVLEADSWMQVTYAYPQREVLLDVWKITRYEGVPHGAEGQTTRWVTRTELKELTFPEGNKTIIDQLLVSETLL